MTNATDCNPLIIGISGKKQSGKDTACAAICQLLILSNLCDGRRGELPTACGYSGLVEFVAFAGYLKQICMDLFGLTREQCYGTDAQKNTKVPSFRDGVYSARSVLQMVGQELRRLDPNGFINAYRATVARSEAPLILTPDVRYPNEVEAIHNMGGQVIRLTREPFDDQHESETALGDWPDAGWDALINNSAMSIERQGEVIRETVTPWLEEAGLIGDLA